MGLAIATQISIVSGAVPQEYVPPTPADVTFDGDADVTFDGDSDVTFGVE